MEIKNLLRQEGKAVACIVGLLMSLLLCSEVRGNQADQLINAAFNNHVEILRLLIDGGADVNAKGGEDGFTALMMGASKGHTDVVKLLLEKGADVNAKAKNGSTALSLAALQGRTAVVKLLIEKGANVQVRGQNGVTALMCAAHQGHLEVVKMLSEKGADVNAKRDDGGTASMIATSRGHTDIANFLNNPKPETTKTSRNGARIVIVKETKEFKLVRMPRIDKLWRCLIITAVVKNIGDSDATDVTVGAECEKKENWICNSQLDYTGMQTCEIKSLAKQDKEECQIIAAGIPFPIDEGFSASEVEMLLKKYPSPNVSAKVIKFNSSK